MPGSVSSGTHCICNCSYLHQAGSQTHEHSGAVAYSNGIYVHTLMSVHNALLYI